MKVRYKAIKSPVGQLYLVADDENLLGVIFQKNWKSFKEEHKAAEKGENAILKRTERQLCEYFNGKRRKFDLQYALVGTEFQRKAWRALAKIPFGQTKTYKEQAVQIKTPQAVRAIGRADGVNPLCIVLPCHRVIGSDGSLTGYAGGLRAKKFLLRLEGVY